MKQQNILLALLMAALCAPQALAEPGHWTIDPQHSSVKFRIKNMMVTSTTGRFKNFSGRVIYDRNNLEQATVDAEIDSASLDTGLAARDHHLKSKDFFNVTIFPKLTFKSEKIIPQPSGAFDIVGVLSMHGVPEQVTLHALALHERIPQTTGSERLLTTATTEIREKDFGIGNGVTGKTLANEVAVTLQIELVRVQ